MSEPIDGLRRLLQGRHSVRAFTPDAVPREVITDAIAVAALAPSWCNTQPWHLNITEGGATERFRKGLMADRADAVARGLGSRSDLRFPGRYAGVYRERRLDTALRLYDAVGVLRGDREASGRQAETNYELFGAPHVAILTTEADLGEYGAVDCGIFLGALLLAFESLGVGAIAQAALAMHSPFLREHFELPENRVIICGISFGWEDKTHPANSFRTSRAQIDELVSWHQ